jgi:hypothetical protein
MKALFTTLVFALFTLASANSSVIHEINCLPDENSAPENELYLFGKVMDSNSAQGVDGKIYVVFPNENLAWSMKFTGSKSNMGSTMAMANFDLDLTRFPNGLSPKVKLYNNPNSDAPYGEVEFHGETYQCNLELITK